MADKVGSAYWDLDLDDKQFKQKMNESSGSIENLKDRFKDAEIGSFALLGTITALGVGIAAFGNESVKAFMESEDALAQTNAVLKSTKGIAGVTADEVERLASEFQSLTKFSDEEIRSAENMLLTFTNISKDIFPDTTRTVLDMSQALGQDLKSSSIQLGKALQDPIQGVTALRRVGVNFSEAQQTMIEEMVKSGKLMEAQKFILEELQTEFGGSAEAAGKTFAGSLTILQNKLNDVQEEIGALIVNALTPVINSTLEWLDSVGGLEGIIAEINKQINEHKDLIYAVAGAITVALLPALISLAASILAALVPLIPFLAVGAAIGVIAYEIVESFGGVENTITKVREVFEGLKASIVDSDFTKNLVDTFNSAPFQEFLRIMREIAENTLVNIQKAFVKLGEIWQVRIQPALMRLTEALRPLAEKLFPILAAAVGGLIIVLGKLWEIFSGLLSPMLDVLGVALEFIINLITKVVEVFTAWITNIQEGVTKGLQFIEGFKNELERGFADVKHFIEDLINKFGEIRDRISNSLSNVANAIIAPFKKAFDWLRSAADQARGFLDKLNPFHRESPSLIDWITRGTDQITDLYDNMFNDINSMSAKNRLAVQTSAQTLDNTIGNSGGIVQRPISLNIDASGIIAGSRGELRETVMNIFAIANEELRARGLPELAIGR